MLTPRRALSFLLTLGLLAPAALAAQAKPGAALTYPVAKTMDHVDDYFGTKVQDPYRWMEDLNTPSWRNGSRRRTR